MQILPYLLILLLLLPQTQGCKNIKARIVKPAKNIFEAPEVQQILLQIIKKRFGVTVKKEDLLKMLSKKEIKYDEKIM